MKSEIFEPNINKQHKFGVVVPTASGPMVIIQTYATKEKLKTGYAEWKKHAIDKGITKPYPVKFIGRGNNKCKILKEMID